MRAAVGSRVPRERITLRVLVAQGEAVLVAAGGDGAKIVTHVLGVTSDSVRLTIAVSIRARGANRAAWRHTTEHDALPRLRRLRAVGRDVLEPAVRRAVGRRVPGECVALRVLIAQIEAVLVTASSDGLDVIAHEFCVAGDGVRLAVLVRDGSRGADGACRCGEVGIYGAGTVGL